MNLLNSKVMHKAFGEGIVISQVGDYITVKFATKQSRFVVPDAFENFLKSADKSVQEELRNACVVKKEAEIKKIQEEREVRLRAEEETRKQAAERPKSKEGAKRVVYDRFANENNLAFKCNFCNGGCSENCLGYKGVCSDEQIWYNIEKKNRAWCSEVEGSYCYKYYKGIISREELEKQHRIERVCYESRMLVDWIAEAGEDRCGVNGRRARRITNASRDSLAVLTTELPDMEGGKERVIFGVFITGAVDEGDEAQAGYVRAAGDFYIELSPDEAKKMKFWHYHRNPKRPEVAQWGMGLYRYMKDTVCARILADIMALKEHSEEKARVQKMLEYYCEVKKLDINNIPDANGAIK